MKSIREISDLNGKTVFLRVDFNVPIENGKVADDFRIKRVFPTIDYLREKGANIILASHMDGEREQASLVPVAKYLREFYDVLFVNDYYPNIPIDLKQAFHEKSLVLLENLRFYDGEKDDNIDFAKHLASFADFFVNEAFAVSHRRHASIVSVPKFLPSFAGIFLEEEIKEISRAFNPEHPFLLVLGGTKFETKIPILKKFFSIADQVFVGGALANDLLKAKGLDVGHSVVSSKEVDVKEFLNSKLILPTDVVVKKGDEVSIKQIDEVRDGDVAVDVGPQSLNTLCSIVKKSRFVLWNGPLGNYEAGFIDGTETLAKCIAEASNTSIVGGGHTVASIAKLDLNDEFTFVSTGGGAMLDFLANETLPGIEALNNSFGL